MQHAPINKWLEVCADLQWKLVYVGSAESEKFDQVLDDVEVGPVKRGKYKFVLQVPHALLHEAMFSCASQ